jgi:Tfp pilus assembly protein FimT
MHRLFYAGFSILELNTVITILTILGILILSSFKQFLMRQERTDVMERLTVAIEYAAQEAFLKNKTTTLCAISAVPSECRLNDWSMGFMVFTLNPKNKKQKEILQILPGTHYGKLYFEQFGQHLNITADGSTINVGTFIYCPHNKNPREAEALVINKASRIYRVTARNSLGIPLKNAGTPEVNPIICR